MDLGLKNRVALVAASSQGIGRATAEGFAAEGCRVAMCARNSQTLQAAADNIRKEYGVEAEKRRRGRAQWRRGSRRRAAPAGFDDENG